MQIFQRAESSAFFGREIGAMYMHAHLRYAEMLAHLGEAGRFWAALSRAHPVALRERVPTASLRQANCYYSSSDAAFADRWQASAEYERVAAGRIALDGGWRVYSSGPGIALALVVGSLLGLRREAAALLVDPVMPPALDGLKATLAVAGRELRLHYRLGPKGCGVTRLLLDGRELPFTRRDNPYREGAAALALSELPAAGGELTVHTG
jgi:cellobiose phosphorylase